MTKLAIAAVLLASALSMHQLRAQSSMASRIDLAASYSASHANVTDGSGFWAQGGGAEVGVELLHHFSVVGSLNGSHSGSAATSHAPFSMLTYTFGPRYSWALPHMAKKHSTNIFGQALFGAAHEFDAALPGSATSATSFALQLGGGVDVGVMHSFAVRAFEADWVRTDLPNGTTGVQNSLRLSAGLVYHF
jgi:hypothetical protein